MLFNTREERGTTELWNCAIPDYPTLTPIPGKFYQVQPDDTLPDIAARVYGYSSDFDAIALAQVINDDPCNAKFHTTKLSAEDSAIYGGAMISLTPTFAVEPEDQSNGVPGAGGYPIIRIPPEKLRQDMRSSTGFQVPTLLGPRWNKEKVSSSRISGGFIHDSCRVYQSKGCLRDFSPLLQAAWTTAASMVEEAYMAFPRPGAIPTNLGQTRETALEEHLGLKPGDFAISSNEELIMEVRAKLAGLNAKFKTRSTQLRCDSHGDVDDSCPGNEGVATPHSFAVCRSLLDMHPPDRRLNLPHVMIHEIMHTLNTEITKPGLDVYSADSQEGEQDGWFYDKLTVNQRSVNPDSYANYVIAGSSQPISYDGSTPRCIFMGQNADP